MEQPDAKSIDAKVLYVHIWTISAQRVCATWKQASANQTTLLQERHVTTRIHARTLTCAMAAAHARELHMRALRGRARRRHNATAWAAVILITIQQARPVMTGMTALIPISATEAVHARELHIRALRQHARHLLNATAWADATSSMSRKEQNVKTGICVQPIPVMDQESA